MTMMVTNAILGGFADTVAQTITAFRHRSQQKNDEGLSKRDDTSVSIHELSPSGNRKYPSYDDGFILNSRGPPPPFDFERLTRFMAYGFCMAPVQFKWFKLLEHLFPISKTAAFGPAMKRVVMDQVVFAPFGLGVFFTAMTLAEGGGRKAVSNKLKDMYFPTLKANYIVWPAVQAVNFRVMPVQYQLVSFLPLSPCAPVQPSDLTSCSLLSRQSASPGPPTYPSPTLPTNMCFPYVFFLSGKRQ